MNFNNIMSSESISPKAFYHKRSFGIPRWTSIPENPFEHSIVLYDHIGCFERPQSEYEDHPLLIEVILDEKIEDSLESLDILGEQAYLLDRTIFINPDNTKFLFFSENDKLKTVSISKSSIEVKLVRLYRMEVVNPSGKKYPKIDTSQEKQNLNKCEIKRDKRINRMKGLLYGYYIGAILSLSKENVKRLNCEREKYNILSAIQASIEHKATPKQRKRLEELYSLSLLMDIRNLISENSGSVESCTTLYKNLVSLLNRYDALSKTFCVDAVISKAPVHIVSSETKNSVLEEVCKNINDIENRIIKCARPLSTDKSEVVVINYSLHHINAGSQQDEDICKAWLNDILADDKYTGSVSTFKQVLSDDVTIKAKEIYGPEKWRESYPCKTLNALRRYLRGEEFPHEWVNDIYSAMAAVIICGDDWHKLLRYMQTKEMTDYRIAFSMYGTLNGFANLPRDFTDVLFNRNHEYVVEVYKEVYGQLFKGDDETLTKSEEKQNEIVSANNGDMPDSEESTGSVKEQNLNKPIASDTTGRDQSEKNEECDCESIEEENTEIYSNRDAKEQGKTLQNGYKKKRTKKSEYTTSNMFQGESTGSFLSDYDYLKNNEEFLSLINQVDLKWSKDFESLFNSCNANQKTDNDTAIRQFISNESGKYSILKDFLSKQYNVNLD